MIQSFFCFLAFELGVFCPGHMLVTLFVSPAYLALSLCALLGIRLELDQLSCNSYYYYFLLKQEYKCCLFAVLTYVHCSVGFKYTFLVVATNIVFLPTSHKMAHGLEIVYLNWYH